MSIATSLDDRQEHVMHRNPSDASGPVRNPGDGAFVLDNEQICFTDTSERETGISG